MKLVFNAFTGNFDYVSVEDLSPYWKRDGTSVCTGDWDLGAYDIRATEFQLGTDATIVFNSGESSIDFVIN